MELVIIRSWIFSRTTTYKSRGNLDLTICFHLIAGFIGQLKGWWDNAPTDEERRFIQKSVDESGNPNAVHTLIYVITKYFLGDPLSFQSRSYEILQNLHCDKLSDYRWYKEVYFAKVHSRTDCNQPYWKERFLNGLPKVFSQKVQIRIKEMYNGIIPYDSLTYGQLANFVSHEALNLCSLIKVNATIKKDFNSAKKELGSFCAQYGYHIPLPPSARHKKFHEYKKKESNKKHSKFRE